MSMKLLVLLEARNEALEAATWYEEQVPGLGADFIQKYESTLVQLAENPYQFSLWPTWKGRTPVRRALFKRFPYGFLFIVRDDSCLVLATAHLRRRPQYWRSRVHKRWTQDSEP